jgi:hypothetical protein
MDGLDWLLSEEVLVISSLLSTSARGWKGLLLNLFWAGGELILGPDTMIELKDRVRAERSGVVQLFCFFCLEKDVIGICVFCGDTNVRFLAIPVASFMLQLCKDFLLT